MSNRDIPEFTAATLPPPQQWEGRTIWRSDLLCHQTSTGLEWRGEVTQDPRTGLLYAGGVPVSVAGISSADLATTAGIAGAMYQLSDGPNKGAKLTWAIPEGATEPTWCWWLWPQAAYTA